MTILVMCYIRCSLSLLRASRRRSLELLHKTQDVTISPAWVLPVKDNAPSEGGYLCHRGLRYKKGLKAFVALSPFSLIVKRLAFVEGVRSLRSALVGCGSLFF